MVDVKSTNQRLTETAVRSETGRQRWLLLRNYGDLTSQEIRKQYRYYFPFPDEAKQKIFIPSILSTCWVMASHIEWKSSISWGTDMSVEGDAMMFGPRTGVTSTAITQACPSIQRTAPPNGGHRDEGKADHCQIAVLLNIPQ